MKRAIIILVYFFPYLANSQFQEIIDIPDNYSAFLIREMKFNDSGQGFFIARPYNSGSSIVDYKVYSTNDYGQTWDSTLFQNQFILNRQGAITESGNMYFASYVNVFPAGQPSYHIKFLNRSLNQGLTWSSFAIDSAVNGSLIDDNALNFLNDSIGLYNFSNGLFLTKDYGSTWVDVQTPEMPASVIQKVYPFNDKFALYTWNKLFQYDPVTGEIDSMDYPIFNQGNQECTQTNGVSIYRSMNNWNGNSLGSNYGANYTSLLIDDLPLGEQRNIHFPQLWRTDDLAVPGNCIYLLGEDRLRRSCDNGEHFYTLNSFPNEPNAAMEFIEFINDTLGFAISRDVVTNDWKLWKTINGGGANGAPVLTNTFYVNVEELKKEESVLVFPNPSSGTFQIRATTEIEKVKLFSLDGRICYESEVKNKEFDIEADNLVQGTYLLYLKTQDGETTQKIVIE